MRRNPAARGFETYFLRAVVSAAFLVCLLQIASFHSQYKHYSPSVRFERGFQQFVDPSSIGAGNTTGSVGSKKNGAAVEKIGRPDLKENNLEEDGIKKKGVDYDELADNVDGFTDGFFNGHPLRYRSPAETASVSYHSTSHCIGDNFSEKYSWQYKSCQFQNFCFDTETHEFVLFASPEQRALDEIIGNKNLTFFSPSTGMRGNGVSIGGINAKLGDDVPFLRWFPTVIDSEEAKKSGVYELPPDSVLAPFHSLGGFNPGHLVWDDWLPLYTILSNFGLLEGGRRHVYMRYIMKLESGQRGLWASCDWKVLQCEKMMEKFMPLMAINKTKFSTTQNFVFATATATRSKYVCSPTGVAGLGSATDHGTKTHGWGPKDYESSHNSNRAASLYAFRNYMLTNIGVSTAPLRVMEGRYRIVFSLRSSNASARDMHNFDDHVRPLQKRLGNKYNLEIISKDMSKLSLVEQAELVSSAAIFVTAAGGGAVSATFLPRGASLFVFFQDEEGDKASPARLDWDFFNHLGYVRTHWMPRPKKTPSVAGSKAGPSELDFESFVRLMDHELDIISHLEPFPRPAIS